MFGTMRIGLLAALKSFASALPELIRDGAGLAAVGSIAYGAWLLHPAAGFIVGGTLVLLGVIASSARPRLEA